MIIKIKKNSFIALIIGILIVGGIIATVVLNPGQSSYSQIKTNQQNSALTNNFSTNINGSSQRQSATVGAVQIDIEPKKLGRDESENSFTAYFNTHSVELDFDFARIITLRDDQGNTYEAVRWTGNRGWHHVSGDIIFPRLEQNAQQVTLEIAGIEGQTQDFIWRLE